MDELLCKTIMEVFYIKNGRPVPKRMTEGWIQEYRPDLYISIVKSFSEDISISNKIGLILKGLTEIPICKVCKTNHVSLLGARQYDTCSNRCAIMSDEVQQKTNETCQKRYGKERYFGVRKEKYKLGEHYLHKNIINKQDIHNYDLLDKLISTGGWLAVAKHFNLTTKSHSSAIRFLRTHCGYDYIHTIKSHPEQDVYEFVLSYFPDAVLNDRSVITPYELDIWIPSVNLAIEMDGMYWHSSSSVTEERKIKNKHLDKTQLCESKNIHLLHIFENEWMYKKDIWESVLLAKCSIYKESYMARKLEVVYDFRKEIIRDFLEKNHLQGTANFSNSISLVLNDEIIQTITLSKPRYGNKYDLEIIRMATKLNSMVVGGFSRLLSKIDPTKSIISYGNRRWCCSYNNAYQQNGFTLKNISEPCWWVYRNSQIETLYHRSSFQKHKLRHKLENYNQTMTTDENIYANNYRKIFDCGNLVYIKEAQ